MPHRRRWQWLTTHDLDPYARRRVKNVHLLVESGGWGRLSGKVLGPLGHRLNSAGRTRDHQGAGVHNDLCQWRLASPSREVSVRGQPDCVTGQCQCRDDFETGLMNWGEEKWSGSEQRFWRFRKQRCEALSVGEPEHFRSGRPVQAITPAFVLRQLGTDTARRNC
jgi:hypothetical protein